MRCLFVPAICLFGELLKLLDCEAVDIRDVINLLCIGSWISFSKAGLQVAPFVPRSSTPDTSQAALVGHLEIHLAASPLHWAADAASLFLLFYFLTFWQDSP